MATPRVLDNLGRLSIITGTVTGNGTDSTVSANDGSLTITGNGTGDYTLTFGQAFTSTPIVVAQVVDATFSTDAANGVSVKASATNSVQFNAWEAVTNGTATDILNAAADLNIGFVVVGTRDR